MSAKVIPFPKHRIVRESPAARFITDVLMILSSDPDWIEKKPTPKPKRPRRK
jgi:hypothetical protein